MPQETSRFTRTIKVKNPDDESQYVALKIIDEISFRDRRFQEYVYTFNNNAEAARQVRVEEIGDGDNKLRVERIEKLSNRDDKQRFQEYIWEYLTEEPPRHLVTHDVKIYATDENGNKDEDVWIKVRRVDKLFVMDEKERFQETELELVWPSDEDYDYTGLGTLYDQEPPYRIDPFQAIIDASWGSKCMLVFYETNKIAALSMPDIKKGAFTVLWKKALEQSSFGVEANASVLWGDRKQIITRQQRLASNVNIASFAGVAMSGGVISVSASSAYITNMEKGLFSGVSLDRSFVDSSAVPCGANFNGSGSSVYTTREDLSVGVDGSLSIVATQSTNYGDDEYMVISPSGERWGCIAGQFSLGYRYSTSHAAPIRPVAVEYGPDGSSSSVLAELTGLGSVSALATMRYLTYSRAGSVDVIDVAETTANVAAADTETGEYGSGDWLSFSYSYDYRAGESIQTGQSAGASAFMVALGAGQEDMFIVSANFDGSGVSVETPYLTRTSSNDNASILPWLQVSNGEVLIQGFITYIDRPIDERPLRHLYIDSFGSSDVLGALAAAIGTGADEINSMLLDVKAADAQGIK